MAILTARREIEELLVDMRHGGRPLPEDLAGTLRARSDVAFQEGQAPEAESYALEALRLAESRLGPHHNQGVLALISFYLRVPVREEAGSGRGDRRPCAPPRLGGLFRALRSRRT